MSIDIDARASKTGALTTQISWTHTPVGTPKGVAVWVGAESGGTGRDASTVTYGGVSLGFVGLVDGGSDAGTVELWFVGENIPTGAQTVVVDFTGTTNDCVAVSETFTGADDLEVVDYAENAVGSASSGSVTLEAFSRTCYFAGASGSGISAPTQTAGSGWTDRFGTDYGNSCWRQHTKDAIGTSDATMTVTQAFDDLYIIGASFSEVVGGAPTVAALAPTSLNKPRFSLTF